MGSKPNISQPTARVKTRTYEVQICDFSNRSTKNFKLKSFWKEIMKSGRTNYTSDALNLLS